LEKKQTNKKAREKVVEIQPNPNCVVKIIIPKIILLSFILIVLVRPGRPSQNEFLHSTVSRFGDSTKKWKTTEIIRSGVGENEIGYRPWQKRH
jgi:hypothetical protein